MSVQMVAITPTQATTTNDDKKKKIYAGTSCVIGAGVGTGIGKLVADTFVLNKACESLKSFDVNNVVLREQYIDKLGNLLVEKIKTGKIPQTLVEGGQWFSESFANDFNQFIAINFSDFSKDTDPKIIKEAFKKLCTEPGSNGERYITESINGINWQNSLSKCHVDKHGIKGIKDIIKGWVESTEIIGKDGVPRVMEKRHASLNEVSVQNEKVTLKLEKLLRMHKGILIGSAVAGMALATSVTLAILNNNKKAKR